MKRVLAMIGWLAMVVPSAAQQPGEDIRGAKPLIEIPVAPEPTPWLLYAVVAVAGLVLIAGLVWWLKRKRSVVFSAEQKAVRKLDMLEKRGASMSAGDFALAASDVVRVFIERKFGLAAPKRSTEEFLEELAQGKDVSLRSRTDSLRGFLKACDMAKFAGINLGDVERGALVTKAREFVETPSDEVSEKISNKKEEA